MGDHIGGAVDSNRFVRVRMLNFKPAAASTDWKLVNRPLKLILEGSEYEISAREQKEMSKFALQSSGNEKEDEIHLKKR